tara:strand:- start:45 stop:1376 length:1332 start_codon:yes stop_codon:yes gene_type:complete
MKRLFLAISAILIFSSIFAQNSSRSSLVFNPVKGLTAKNMLDLSDAYHNMNDLKYHCFHLVSKHEQSRFQPSKLAKLIKERSAKIMTYYKESHQVKAENMFVKYDGGYPILWLHKPTSLLTASGKIDLEEENMQCFSFNPSIDETIYTASGNTFYFPPNSFETLNGLTIKNKSINICLWEFSDKKSLVYSGLTTEANGKMLESGGSFYITATYDSKKLRLKKGELYTVEMSYKQSHPDMFTCYGNKNDGIINWNVDKNEPVIVNGNNDLANYKLDDNVEIQIDEDSAITFSSENYDAWKGEQYDEYSEILDAEYIENKNSFNFYEMTAGKLGWINCDRFYDTKKTSPLIVRVNSAEDMVVRLVFRDINSVMPAYSNSNHKDQYEAMGIPTGEKVLLLAYSVKDENALFGYKEIVIGENELENVSLNALTKNRFKSAVSELLSY